MQNMQFCVDVDPYCTSTEDGIFYTFFSGATATCGRRSRKSAMQGVSFGYG